MDFEAICAGIRAQRKKYLTQQEVAALCQLSKKTIYKLERSGALPYEEQVNRLIHTHVIKTDDVMSIDMVSEYIGYTRNSVAKWVSKGTLKVLEVR